MRELGRWIGQRWESGRLLWDIAVAVVSAVGFGIPAWAAAASAWLNAWGPIAWIVAGLMGLAIVLPLFLLASFVMTIVRHRWLMSSILRKFYEAAERVNPLQKVFSQHRIRIEDMFPPLTVRIFDKTFIECELIGPAVISIEGSAVFGGGGEAVDAVVGPTGQITRNSLFFDRCVFRDCRFYKVTFIVAETSYQQFCAQNPSIPFVSLLPPMEQQPLPLPATPAVQTQIANQKEGGESG